MSNRSKKLRKRNLKKYKRQFLLVTLEEADILESSHIGQDDWECFNYKNELITTKKELLESIRNAPVNDWDEVKKRLESRNNI